MLTIFKKNVVIHLLSIYYNNFIPSVNVVYYSFLKKKKETISHCVEYVVLNSFVKIVFLTLKE